VGLLLVSRQWALGWRWSSCTGSWRALAVALQLPVQYQSIYQARIA